MTAKVQRMSEQCYECGKPANHQKWRQKFSGGYWDWFCDEHKPESTKAKVNARKVEHPVSHESEGAAGE